jgi:hypothetical protein
MKADSHMSQKTEELRNATQQIVEQILAAHDENTERLAGDAALQFVRKYGGMILASIEDSCRIDLFQKIIFDYEHVILDVPEEILALTSNQDGIDNLKLRTMIDAFANWYAEHGVTEEVLERKESNPQEKEIA